MLDFSSANPTRTACRLGTAPCFADLAQSFKTIPGDPF
jgi:hypothetical protein